MRDKLAKLIDLKSIITLLLVVTLVVIVLANIAVDDNRFALFSNVLTMVVTYFFTKQKKEGD